jgi:hypothetical protein
MEVALNKNIILSSNLFFLSIVLGFINVLLSPEIFSSVFAIVVSAVTFIILIIIGISIRQGVGWIKYLLACLMVIGLPFTYSNIIHYFQMDDQLNALISISVTTADLGNIVII